MAPRPSEVRVRRDFPQTLSLIQASAVLHQRQRDRDDQGRIVASFDDYELIHELVEESLKSAKGNLTSAQRAAVEAVQTLYEPGQQESVRVAAVAKALGIDRSAATRRLVRPVAEGFVVNVEERKNHSQLDEILTVRFEGKGYKPTWPNWVVWSALTTFKDTGNVFDFLRKCVFHFLPPWDKDAIRRALGVLVERDATFNNWRFADPTKSSRLTSNVPSGFYSSEMDIILWERLRKKELTAEWVCPRTVIGFLFEAAKKHQATLYNQVARVKIKLVSVEALPEWAGTQSRKSSIGPLDDRDTEERALYDAEGSIPEVKEQIVFNPRTDEYELRTSMSRVGARGLETEWQDHGTGNAGRRIEDADLKATRSRVVDEERTAGDLIKTGARAEHDEDAAATRETDQEHAERLREKKVKKRRTAAFYEGSLDARDPDTIGHAPGLPPTPTPEDEVIAAAEEVTAAAELEDRRAILESTWDPENLTVVQRRVSAALRAGLSQAEIARNQGVSRQAVNKVVKELRKLARAGVMSL